MDMFTFKLKLSTLLCVLRSATAIGLCDQFKFQEVNTSDISCTATYTNEAFPRCYHGQTSDCIAIGRRRVGADGGGDQWRFDTCVVDYTEDTVEDWDMTGIDAVHFLVYEFHPSGNYLDDWRFMKDVENN